MAIGIENWRDLELRRHGLKLLKPMAASFTPCLDGRHLLLGMDDEHDYLEISKFSRRDAEAYPRWFSLYNIFLIIKPDHLVYRGFCCKLRSWLMNRYERQLHKYCKFMDFILDSRTPEALHKGSSFNHRLREKVQNSIFWGRCLQHALSLGQKDMV